jgi:N-carbamoyl-L-amino-acid hydrolase
MQQGMARLGISYDTILNAARDPEKLVGYLEVHPEQGKRLERSKIDVGVVTSIVGIRSLWLGFGGEAAHAGTQPMDERHDALWGASDFVMRARDLVMKRFSPGVMNCGKIGLAPSAFNIVPERVELALEFRHGTDELLDEMEDVLRGLAHEVAAAYGLRLAIVVAGRYEPALMDERLITAIETASAAMGVSHTRLMSFAGHDAQTVSRVTPSAMFFVPSVDGISHNPKEYTHDRDVENGANVLLHAVLGLAQQTAR